MVPEEEDNYPSPATAWMAVGEQEQEQREDSRERQNSVGWC